MEFTCEVTTPMFLNGADKYRPELRSASLKGVLRYWWRALHGHLRKEELHQTESEIFGGVNPASKSSIILKVVPVGTLQYASLSPVPHKSKSYTLPCIEEGSTFKIVYHFRKIPRNNQGEEIFNEEQFAALLEFVSIVGGLGKRTRRGMGCFQLVGSTLMEISIDGIVDLLRTLKVNKFFQNTGDSLITLFDNTHFAYPYIRKIEIGRQTESLLKKISDTTHQFNREYGFKYGDSMGKARGGRFSSPIVVSTFRENSSGNTLIPIVTTLNTVTPSNWKPDISIQEKFKSAILY